MPKSCYVLEISVTPGGARRGDLFTYNRLLHLRYCLKHELFAEDPADRAYAASLAAGYGETIVLWVVENDRLVRAVDLRRHIRIRVDGEPGLTLVEARARDDAWKDRLADGTRIA